jgi:DNA adenine methylase
MLTTVVPFSRALKKVKPARRRTEGKAESQLRPFLRWAGGKQLLLNRILPFLPQDVSRRRYWEPFLGAASMFFAIRPLQAFLSDANSHLMRCYEAVRESPRVVARHVARHARLDCVAHYYEVRQQYNRRYGSAAQAARFIYLNRTCFNGIFRVNAAGDFNVPYAYKRQPHFPTLSGLQLLGQALRFAELGNLPFQVALEGPERGDFVYLDPPYPALSDTAYFAHYTMDRFNEVQQSCLVDYVHALHARGVLFMMTNANTPDIRRLYRRFYQNPVFATRYITCKAVRHRVGELVITNYEVA